MPETQPSSASAPFPRPIVVAILFLLNYALAVSAIVGVVLAYVWRAEESTPEWERSHYTYLIRTFWFSLIGFGLAFLLMWLTGMRAFMLLLPLVLVVGLWTAVRAALSIARAVSRTPIARPESLWF